MAVSTLAMLAMAATAMAAGGRPPPNVLYLMSDDMRPQMSTYGHPAMITPELDELANMSLVFDFAYTQFAYCAPARSSFLSGRRPPRTRVLNFNNPFRKVGKDAEDWVTMPQAFKNAGYFTSAGGKLYHDSLPDPKSWSYPANHTRWIKCVKGDIIDKYGNYCGITSESVEQLTDEDLALDAGLDRLDRGVKSGKPWFVGIGVHRPHWPYRVPKGFYGTELFPANSTGGDPIKPARFRLPPTNVPWMAPNAHEGDVKDPAHGCPTCVVPVDREVEYRRWYSAACTYSSHMLGRAITALKQYGQDVVDNTIVIWHADHGYQLGELNEWSKKTDYDLATRVPLMVHVPWLPASQGKRSSVMAELQDLYPTLAELAGLGEVQEGVQGTSLAPLFEHPESPSPELATKRAYSQIGRCGCHEWPQYGNISQCSDGACVFTPLDQFDFMGYTVRTPEGWRYTAWAKWNGTSLQPNWDDIAGRELYDLRSDPGTTFDFPGYAANVAGDPANKGIVATLHSELRTAFESFE